MPSTALCRELGIEHPIFSVGFAAAAGPELAAAVSGAGGFGVLGGSGRLTADDVRDRIRRTHELTDRPFGLNLIIKWVELGDPEGIAWAEERIGIALEERVAVLVFFCGDPTPYVDEAHRHGVRVAVQVGSVEEAERAAAGGVDIVIAQGLEAGGHVRAPTSLLVNLPTIVDAVAPLPVLASGGIADGRGLAAALALGAQGVSLGTRFVASDEAWIPADYKRRVVAAGAADTVYGYLFDVGFPDTPHRMLRNRVVAEWEAAGRPEPGGREHEDDTVGVITMPDGERAEIPRYASMMAVPEFEGDLELVPLWAGESVALVREVAPAGEIVQRIAREADEVIAQLAG